MRRRFLRGVALLELVDTAVEPKAPLSRRVLIGSTPVFVSEAAP